MNYILFILLGACVALHVWMMFRGHGGRKEQNGDKHKENNHSGSCH
jgi:hypothetical protein